VRKMVEIGIEMGKSLTSEFRGRVSESWTDAVRVAAVAGYDLSWSCW
jgi:hypothetical protein